jgi:hypothetical protein
MDQVKEAKMQREGAVGRRKGQKGVRGGVRTRRRRRTTTTKAVAMVGFQRRRARR